MAMDHSRLRAQLAVLSILRDVGVPIGEPVFVGELARHWADYGIRASDLGPALDDLAWNGLILRRSETPDQVQGTAAGQQWLQGQPAWMEYELLVPRASRVAFQRLHQDRPRAPVHHRRRDDITPRRSTA